MALRPLVYKLLAVAYVFIAPAAALTSSHILTPPDRAKQEVIVSSGFIDSPKLLLLSGIGPKRDLEALNIPVVSDSPNVGKNMFVSIIALPPPTPHNLQILKKINFTGSPYNFDRPRIQAGPPGANR